MSSFGIKTSNSGASRKAKYQKTVDILPEIFALKLEGEPLHFDCFKKLDTHLFSDYDSCLNAVEKEIRKISNYYTIDDKSAPGSSTYDVNHVAKFSLLEDLSLMQINSLLRSFQEKVNTGEHLPKIIHKRYGNVMETVNAASLFKEGLSFFSFMPLVKGVGDARHIVHIECPAPKASLDQWSFSLRNRNLKLPAKSSILAFFDIEELKSKKRKK